MNTKLPPLFPALCAIVALLLASRVEASVTPQFAAQDDLANAASLAVMRAKHRIDAVLPDLADEVVAEALLATAKRGTAVRVVLSGAAPGVAEARCKPCDLLELAGGDVRHLDRTVRVAERLIVIDGPRSRSSSGILGRVLVASGPLATPAADQTLVAIEKEGGLALAYQNEFNFLWSRASEYDDAARRGRAQELRVPAGAPVQFATANLAPIELDGGWMLTPALDRRPAALTGSVAQAIALAYDTIDVSAPDLRSPEIFAALAGAIERGVRVRLLLSRREFGGELQRRACVAYAKVKGERQDECLAAFGAAVRYAAPAAAIESRTVVVDGKTALTGTFGWTQATEARTLGSLLSLRGDPAKAFARDFERRFAAARSPFKRPPTKAYEVARVKRASCGQAAAKARPIGYSYSEMRRLRAAYERSLCD